MKIVTFTFPHIYEEFICPCSHIYVCTTLCTSTVSLVSKMFHICHRYFFLCPNHSIKKLKSLTSTDHQCRTSFMPASDQKLSSNVRQFAKLLLSEKFADPHLRKFPPGYTGLGFRWSSVVHVFVALRVFGRVEQSPQHLLEHSLLLWKS